MTTDSRALARTTTIAAILPPPGLGPLLLRPARQLSTSAGLAPATQSPSPGETRAPAGPGARLAASVGDREVRYERDALLGLLPCEYWLLEVRHPDCAVVQGNLAELVDDRRSRRVEMPAKERQLNDRRPGLRNTQQPGCDVKMR